MNIILYSGKDCCLCDQAEDLINGLNNNTIILNKVDVRSTSDLYHLYGARIPVVFRSDTQQELPWPFDSHQLKEFLF
ncbi:glutaredoxin family protein [Paraglaciecola sp.]|uniref:glutaredoxin family protein n=1 Tax=Paraglaciecola sp. TaxID=1920173 RepID=UPI003EF26C4D